VARNLDAEFRRRVADAGIPGASAAVVFPDGREWSAAAGDAVLRPRRRMTTRTALPFDSVTKVATAALALRLVEQGRLRLEDPVARWYASWRGDDRATVRDLLGHTAGLGDPGEAFFRMLVRRPGARVTAREFLAATPTPGGLTKEAVYSNAGFVLAGLILERAAGEPLATAMRRELFDAPGGEGLAMQPSERARPPRAHSYWYPHGLGDPEDATDGSAILPSPAFAGAAGAAGALAGDVPSLARWGHELFGGHILQTKSLREMATFHDGAFWEGYGLGLALDSNDDRPMWGHGGDGFGTHTEFWHLPRERLTIAMTWNDDVLDREGRILPTLLRAALGYRK
jgi:D-alanyl-D-alanine carboxypeptidase